MKMVRKQICESRRCLLAKCNKMICIHRTSEKIIKEKVEEGALLHNSIYRNSQVYMIWDFDR